MVSGERQVLSLAPWNKHNLSMRSFADRLHDLNHLLILYPNEPKDKVFGKYYTPTPGKQMDGQHIQFILYYLYVPTVIRTYMNDVQFLFCCIIAPGTDPTTGYIKAELTVAMPAHIT